MVIQENKFLSRFGFNTDIPSLKFCQLIINQGQNIIIFLTEA